RRHHHEAVAAAVQILPGVEPVGLDVETAVRAQALVALREAPGEAPQGTEDPPLAFPPAARPQHRLQIVRHRGPDVAQGDGEEAGAEEDHRTHRPLRQDAHAEAVDAEPEDAGDVERPKEAAGPARLRRVGWSGGRGVARCNGFHDSFRPRATKKAATAAALAARGIPDPWAPLYADGGAPPMPAVPGRWRAGRPKRPRRPWSRRSASPVPASRRGCRSRRRWSR